MVVNDISTREIFMTKYYWTIMLSVVMFPIT
jgi:hypothetical protein